MIVVYLMTVLWQLRGNTEETHVCYYSG